ncbi:haloacid dehalogenase-like hydrolase [Streptomyces sp. NPDC002911]
MKLVLWHIDHTLVATRRVGREIFGYCFGGATGHPMREQAAVDGMTEPVIFREAAKLHGITSDRPMVEAFARLSAEEQELRAGDLRERRDALPGMAPLLAAVAALGGVKQTVVTGNIRGAAVTKLRCAGSTRIFSSRSADTARTTTNAPNSFVSPSAEPAAARTP